VTILVTGARGRIATDLIDELLAAGADVRAATSDPAALRLPTKVDVRRATLRDSTSLADALRGVSKVFLYCDPSGIDTFLAAVRDTEVRHLVVLSSITVTWADAESAGDGPTSTESGRPPLTEDTDPIAWRHAVVERAVADSGIPWTFVRPGMFATNTLRWAPRIRTEREVQLARPGAEAAPVHERDIADVAARALLEPGHEQVHYSLTGPESLSQRRQVELIGDAINHPLRIVEMSDDEAREQLARWSAPAVADRLVAGLIATDGHPAQVLDTDFAWPPPPGKGPPGSVESRIFDFARPPTSPDHCRCPTTVVVRPLSLPDHRFRLAGEAGAEPDEDCGLHSPGRCLHGGAVPTQPPVSSGNSRAIPAREAGNPGGRRPR
jgi:uncharacterized protein YbjT (DUF2867 family)